MTPRLTARDRLARLLSVIPWVVENGGASVDVIADRFDYPRDQLLRDLREILLFVGVHPFTPDTMIEVDIVEDHVSIRYADWFARPLRLGPEEAARLLTAGRSALEFAPEDDSGPLVRALAKLELALGDGAGEALDIRLGDAPEAVLDGLRDAAVRRVQVDIEYYSYGRDELTSRRIEPARVFSDSGQWYVSAWCHLAGDERVFRVDRIRHLSPTSEPARAETAGDTDVGFAPAGDDPRVVLRLDPSAQWVVDTYPTDSVERADDGSTIVRMAVTATPWLARLLLRLGPAAEVLEIDARIGERTAAAAATRILSRYRT